MVSFTSRPNYPGEEKAAPVPNGYRLGGPHRRLDDVEKRKFFTLPGLKLRPLGRPARSQSLYRIRYPTTG
jgi:hypothetical protein